MADVYNMTFLDNISNPVDIVTGLNNLTSYEFLIGNMILLAFFIIFLILALRSDFNEVLIIDSFITSILAGLFYAAGVVSVLTIVYPVVLFFISLVFYLFNK